MSPDNAWEHVLDEINHCNKCGFCLPNCPTYRLTGEELHSPRGRIAMVEAAARGELEHEVAMEEALSYCVGCRACETACPSGVHYERILEAGRNYLISRGSRAFAGNLVSRQTLTLARHPQRFKRMVALARKLRRLPLPPAFSKLRDMLPPSPSSPVAATTTTSTKPPKRVLFFEGCVMEAAFEEVNRAVKNLLAEAGFDVLSAREQTCCGAIHFHSGETQVAMDLAKQNIKAFESDPDVFIVNTAGGCGAMLHEYQELFRQDSEWKDRARRFSDRVRDFSTLLLHEAPVRLRFQGTGERIALQNSCHLVNVSKAGQDPIRLLQQVEGDQWVPYFGQDICCGSGGVYNLTHTDWALGILDQKMAALSGVSPRRIIVNNPGCHLQMQWGVRRHPQIGAEVEHLGTYLWHCYQRAGSTATTV